MTPNPNPAPQEESEFSSQVRALATLVAVELFNSIRFDNQRTADHPIDMLARLRIEPQNPADPAAANNGFAASASIDAEYTCFLDGFGSYVEKFSRSIPNANFSVPKTLEFPKIDGAVPGLPAPTNPSLA
jgi:hypothetical protein